MKVFGLLGGGGGGGVWRLHGPLSDPGSID